MGDRQRSEAASTIFAVQDYAGTWSAERGSATASSTPTTSTPLGT